MRHDIFFADHTCRRHSQRLENAVAQEVAVELSADFVDEDSQSHVSKVAVAPLLARLKCEWDEFDLFQHLALGVIATKIEVGWIIGHATSVSEQVADGDLFPGSRRARKILGD